VNLPPTRFSRYLRAVGVELATHPEWRPGQACVNVTSLYPEFRELPPGLTDDFDPWNDDDRVPEFLAVLRTYWLTEGEVER
jgi:hypothetical protein